MRQSAEGPQAHATTTNANKALARSRTALVAAVDNLGRLLGEPGVVGADDW